MAVINESRTADIITEQLSGGEPLRRGEVLNQALLDWDGASPFFRGGPGFHLGFFENNALSALTRAYASVTEQVSPASFATEVAALLQEFAGGVDESGFLAYPDFLLHDTEHPTLSEVLSSIGRNIRIMHNTLAVREELMAKCFPVQPHPRYRIVAGNGQCEDHLGISTKLLALGSSHNLDYISMVSFFLDLESKDAYVITVQGKRFKVAGRNDGFIDYSRAAGYLNMSPRVCHLKEVSGLLANEGFQRIRVIHPDDHPFTKDSHDGWYGGYEPIIKKAGIGTRNGCYLEADLVSGKA